MPAGACSVTFYMCFVLVLIVAFLLFHNVMELFSKVKVETGLGILFMSLLDFLD